MYADIAVKTTIPSINKSYTYQIPPELEPLAKVGKMVDVPFGKKNLEGIILNIHNNKPNFAVKDIIKIDPNEPLLTEEGIEIARWISWRYSSNLYDCFTAVLPKQETKQVVSELKPNKTTLKEKELELRPFQQKALEDILNDIYGEKKGILLHGVTGSGKTEIYLQITKTLLEDNKQVIFMVPEISLTPQLLGKFSDRFGIDSIAVVHSHISRSIRDKTWKSIRNGEKKIIIGSRSAILSPVSDLGAIIIDECHEQSYKQDKSPKYNAIELAKYITRKFNAELILGSATPLIEQYFEAKNGLLKLVEMHERISGMFPNTEVVDLREERKNKNYSLISNRLLEKAFTSINKNEQVMLYLNRRGIKSAILCTTCGSYEMCPNCDMPLTLHNKKGKPVLVCHYCFYTRPLGRECSTCGSKFIKGIGNGTQSIQEEVIARIPEAKPIIMDKDTTQAKGSHEAIYNAFKKNEANVLIGTQMITKGLDISSTSLTGYLLLDSDLLFPSFRTSERVYQLITQFAGRSGRGDIPGTNIIQTYNPNNRILLEALKQDYLGFYKNEIEIREKLSYPPFVRLIQVTTKGKDETKALAELKRYILTIKQGLTEALGRDAYQVLGPSRSFLGKINTEYFFQATFKVPTDQKMFEKTIEVFNEIKRNGSIQINVDPFDLD